MSGLVFTIKADNELVMQTLARKFDQLTCSRVEIYLKRSGRTLMGPYWIAEFRVPWEKTLDFIRAVQEEKKQVSAVKIVGVRGW